jgi:PAS domain S-box-containing protein
MTLPRKPQPRKPLAKAAVGRAPPPAAAVSGHDAAASRQAEPRQANEHLDARLIERTAALASANATLAALDMELRHLRTRTQRADERLALALAAAGLAWWDCDLATGDVYVSEEWAHLLGGERKPTRTTLAALLEAVHPDDRDELQRLFIACVKGEQSAYQIVHRIRDLRGKWRWIDSRGQVVERDGAGRALRAAGTNMDVTSRVLTEQAWRDSEALLRAFTDEMPMLLAYVDRDERYRFVNRTWEKWFGLAPAAVLGRTVREVAGDAEYEPVHAPIVEALAGTPATITRDTHVGGVARRLVMRCFPHRDGRGNIIGAYAFIEDVSDALHQG